MKGAVSNVKNEQSLYVFDLESMCMDDMTLSLYLGENRLLYMPHILDDLLGLTIIRNYQFQNFRRWRGMGGVFRPPLFRGKFVLLHE